MECTGAGSLPALRTGTKPTPRSWAIIAPRMKPRASIANTESSTTPRHGAAIASTFFAFLASARVFAAETTAFLRLPAALGGGATGVGFSMQFALLGAGHLIGLAVGLTQLFGLVSFELFGQTRNVIFEHAALFDATVATMAATIGLP